MKTITISKGPGRPPRIVTVCPRALRPQWRALARGLDAEVRRRDQGDLIHGCTAGHSPVTAALAHVGYPWTVTADLAAFFDGVRPEQLPADLPAPLREALDAAQARAGRETPSPQGLPHAPAVANLAALALDRAILGWIAGTSEDVAYTRYVDDLTLSCRTRAGTRRILAALPGLVAGAGFALAPRKTRVLSGTHGRRRIIMGVSVGETDIRPPRATRRRLRVARHRGERGDIKAAARAGGLAAWCELRVPRALRTEAARELAVAALVAARLRGEVASTALDTTTAPREAVAVLVLAAQLAGCTPAQVGSLQIRQRTAVYITAGGEVQYSGTRSRSRKWILCLTETAARATREITRALGWRRKGSGVERGSA